MSIYTEIEVRYSRTMPKWKGDAKEFTVGVNYSDVRGYQATIPKPVMAKLGNPERLTFATVGRRVEVRAAGHGLKVPSTS